MTMKVTTTAKTRRAHSAISARLPSGARGTSGPVT